MSAHDTRVLTESDAQVLCRDSRLSLCACTCRAVRRETDESRRAVARVYVCALHKIWCECGVQQLSRVTSFLCMGRCKASRWRKTHASLPSGRDACRRTHHTVLYAPGALVQRRSRALRPHPSRILWARVVRAYHSLLARHPLLSLQMVTRPPNRWPKACLV